MQASPRDLPLGCGRLSSARSGKSSGCQEIDKLSEERKASEQKALKLSKQLEASQAKAAKALEASAKLKASAKAAATKALEDNSSLFGYTDLSKEAVSQIRHLYLFGLKRCSRCRWQRGCLSCDHEYLFRYLMKKEALKRSKVPLATGQETP